MPIAKRVIRILVGWGRMPIQDFVIFALSVWQKMTDNAALYPKPPVDLATLKSEADRLQSLSAEATYKDSRMIVARDKLRGEVHIMLRQLAYFVEALCNIEKDPGTRMNLVERSGFEAVSSTGSPEEVLLTRITRIDNPRTGVLHVRYATAGRKASQYQIRMAVKGTPDPDSWPIQFRPIAKEGALFENLTPAVVYTFQVRVFGNLGFGDWCPAVDKMCT